VVFLLAYLGLTAVVTASVVSALTYPDRAWAQVRRSRVVTVACLAALLAFWVLILTIPHYWMIVRPQLKAANRAPR
jgi:hypothetical protein